jgi:hypothetical protein
MVANEDGLHDTSLLQRDWLRNDAADWLRLFSQREAHLESRETQESECRAPRLRASSIRSV